MLAEKSVYATDCQNIRNLGIGIFMAKAFQHRPSAIISTPTILTRKTIPQKQHQRQQQQQLTPPLFSERISTTMASLEKEKFFPKSKSPLVIGCREGLVSKIPKSAIA
ncbi:hypothetical protein T4D_17090 [Trichinella pseudospiralis]|uniref:Uncharacterized protein n=1 Tax=Trichinella pseudospiralis TaxID=6337 RepID=A0A0V1FI86_TRIPS|nr:hypothetical protein T4D_17090 [Trichinella pseudospiralis]